MEPSPSSRRRRRWPLVIAAVLVVLVGGSITAFALRPTATIPQDRQAAAPTATAVALTPTTIAAATTSSSITSTGSANTTGLPTGSKYLTADSPVDRDRYSDNGGEQTGSFRTSGKQYGHAISMAVYCSNNDGGDYWIDYDLARSWTTFTTTVGLRDDSPANASVTYTLILDTKVVASGPLTLGTAVPITIPVTNGLRLRLKMNNPAGPLPNCGSSTSRAQLVWGDPKLDP